MSVSGGSGRARRRCRSGLGGSRRSRGSLRSRVTPLSAGSAMCAVGSVWQVRRAGAGRPRLTDIDPTLLDDLQALVDPETRGDPTSALRWTSKSLVKIAGALSGIGHQVSDVTAGKLLKGLGFRLHANVKTRGQRSSRRPDRRPGPDRARPL